MRSMRALFVVAAVLPVLLLAACSSASSTVTAAPTIADSWVRPPLGPDRPAAGYLVITGAADHGDALVGASSPVAASVEIHETTADASGMMAMHPVDELAIPAGTAVKLEPGGYHLMLMDLSEELEVGATVDLVLEFESAGEVTVQAQIRQG
jgi:periplasmic copper chaperone A